MNSSNLAKSKMTNQNTATALRKIQLRSRSNSVIKSCNCWRVCTDARKDRKASGIATTVSLDFGVADLKTVKNITLAFLATWALNTRRSRSHRSCSAEFSRGKAVEVHDGYRVSAQQRAKRDARYVCVQRRSEQQMNRIFRERHMLQPEDVEVCLFTHNAVAMDVKSPERHAVFHSHVRALDFDSLALDQQIVGRLVALHCDRAPVEPENFRDVVLSDLSQSLRSTHGASLQ